MIRTSVPGWPSAISTWASNFRASARLKASFVYLAVILDAYSRMVIGWSLEDHMEAKPGVAALEMAVRDRQPSRGQVTHHSDRGVQYACGDYADKLETYGIISSMSRWGCPYDNAKVESFMKTLKQEQVDGADYRTSTMPATVSASSSKRCTINRDCTQL